MKTNKNYSDSGFTTKTLMQSGGYRKIDRAPECVSDIVKEAGIDWTVRTEPLYRVATGWDGSSVQEVPVKIGTGHRLVLTSMDEQLAVVGPQWSPVDNFATFEPFQRFLDSGQLECVAAGSTDGKRGVFAMFRITASFDYAGGERIDAYLYVIGDHSGRGAHRMVVTAKSLICMNQLGSLRSGKGSILSASIRHVGDAESKWRMIDAQITESTQGVGSMVDRAEMMSSRTVSGEGQLRSYFAEVMKPSLPTVVDIMNSEGVSFGEAKERRLEMYPKSVDRLVELYEDGIGQEHRYGMWRAFSAVTQYVTHERGRENIRLRSSVDGDGAKVIHRAETMAMAA